MGLTSEEKKLYSQLFKALDSEGSGIVTGEKARTTFEKSGLPPNILGEIWQLADQKNVGFLTQFGFCLAMRLIGYTQAGQYPSAGLAEQPGPLPKFSNLGLTAPAPTGSLNPQLTNNSLLQSQPSAIVPQNTTTQQLQPLDPIGPVSAVDYERFKSLFVKTTGSEAVPLDGAAARDILMKAKLPTPTLGQVWSLVDVHNKGSLDLSAFVMAMHLIHGLISGKIRQLPPFLPEFVWQSVETAQASSLAGAQNRQISQASMSSQLSTIRHPPARQPKPPQVDAAESEWSVNSQQKLMFDSMFDNLDTQKTGKLSPDQVASFLMTSRLNQQDLATIWDLSDIQNTGVFTKVEFGIALFLVNRKRAGLPLPNIVPDALIKSLSATPVNAQPQQQVPQGGSVGSSQPQGLAPQHSLSQNLGAPQRSKSSMDELADIFGLSPEPLPRVASPTTKPPLRPSGSSSDLSPNDLPKVRKQLSSSFKPTSSFGQNLLSQQLPSQSGEPQSTLPTVPEPPSLIGDDVPHHSPVSSPAPVSRGVSSPGGDQSGSQPANASKPHTVDYEALRSVPPPPPKKSGEHSTQASSYFPEPQNLPATGSPLPKSANPEPQNSDLLADSEVSGQLSQANTDIANISNQVKSLTTQTSSLHEKKSRADRELSRIMSVKEEIDNKLKLLRASYANEVKQVEQVEKTLTNAKEETEALRSEASISEAKLNNVSSELHEKQVAVEELEKTNSGLREKLGYLNAEIVELQKTLEAKLAENIQLSKDSNVKKSQVQVAIVKVDELKSKIASIELSNARMVEEMQKHEQDKIAAENQARELQEKHDQLSRQGPPSYSGQQNNGSAGAALSTVAGAAVGGLAGLAGGHALSRQSEDNHNQTGNQQGPSQFVQKAQDEPQIQQRVHQRDVEPQANRSLVIPGSLDFENSDSGRPSSSSRSQVAGLVDEVMDKPSEDMTGVDDFENAQHKERPEEQHKQDFDESVSNYAPQSMEAIQERFSEPFDNGAARTVPSSDVTDSYKPTDDSVRSDTPVTSPNNSEYQFQPSAAGVVGGMVGMPGVLVGVQRTDSLTSSIQNNPSLSVRDDNIDEVSERDTLGGDVTVSPAQTRTAKQQKNGEGREESSEGERISSGVELFEIVNADEARGLDSQNTIDGSSTSLPQVSLGGSEHAGQPPVPGGDNDEEFPPIRELNYEESSSSDEEGPEDKFDDAVDHMNSSINAQATQPQPSKNDEFDFDDDLKPATQEAASGPVGHDAFEDEFDDLKVADDDNEDFDAPDVGLDDHFTGAEEPTSGYKAPTFAEAGSNFQPDDNDEWEKLFAGFGNAPQAKPEGASQGASLRSSTPIRSVSGHSHALAVNELVGMGFDEKTATEALKRENWNLENATNYLLDHA